MVSPDVDDALAFALRFQDRKRLHKADEFMSAIVAKRLVDHLEQAGFVVVGLETDPLGAIAPNSLRRPRLSGKSATRLFIGGLLRLESG